MQKETKTIQFQLKEGSKTLTFGFHPIFQTYVDVRKVLLDHPDGCLLMRHHKFLQTQLILCDVRLCRLMVFDESGRFVSLKIHDMAVDAPVSLFIPEVFTLILPTGSDLLKENISSMEMVQSHKNDKANNKN
ncbi:MAG: hypothetical protein KAT76_07550 [Bacteroidales bacterium]|nr:hypothetical protein [Bacteroidales bacterium]